MSTLVNVPNRDLDRHDPKILIVPFSVATGMISLSHPLGIPSNRDALVPSRPRSPRGDHLVQADEGVQDQSNAECTQSIIAASILTVKSLAGEFVQVVESMGLDMRIRVPRLARLPDQYECVL